MLNHEADRLEQDQIKAIRKARAALNDQLEKQKTSDKDQLKALQDKIERIQEEANEIIDIQSEDEMVSPS